MQPVIDREIFVKTIIFGENRYMKQFFWKKSKSEKNIFKKMILSIQLLFVSLSIIALSIGNIIMSICILLMVLHMVTGEDVFLIFLVLLWGVLGVIVLIPVTLVNYISSEKGVLSNRLRTVISISLLEVLLINILFFTMIDNPPATLPWSHMWFIAIWMYAFFKWITLAYGRHSQKLSFIGSLIYLFGWVGMNPDPFLKASPKKTGKWNSSLFIRGVRNLLIGVLLFFSVHYFDANLHLYYKMPWLLQSWIICVGLIMVLHFGLFHLLAWFWQGVGYSVKPIMSNPLAAQKISEFWGGRWNIAFKHIVSPFLFMPLKKKLGPSWGVFCTFLFSGLVHELVISLPAGAGYGLPTLYFLIQALGMRIERLSLSWLSQKLFTYIVIIGPVFILFHPPFMREVITPYAEEALRTFN